MVTIKALKCPSCGASVSDFIGSTGTCEYCGSSLLIKDDTVSVARQAPRSLQPEPEPSYIQTSSTTSLNPGWFSIVTGVVALIAVAVALGIGYIVLISIMNAAAAP